MPKRNSFSFLSCLKSLIFLVIRRTLMCQFYEIYFSNSFHRPNTTDANRSCITYGGIHQTFRRVLYKMGIGSQYPLSNCQVHPIEARCHLPLNILFPRATSLYSWNRQIICISHRPPYLQIVGTVLYELVLYNRVEDSDIFYLSTLQPSD
jgi:hypothetical protein